jgi:type I restriction enzyme S subunit
LPRGWCWGSIELVGDVLLGRRRAGEEYVAGQEGRVLRSYVRVANVKEDRLVLDDVLQMPFNDVELALYRLKPGDIILSEGQSPELVGQSAVFNGEVDDLCIQATVHRFRAFEFATTSDFAQLVFLNHLHSGVFQRASALTTNIAHLTSERLKPLQFPVPPLEEQRLVVSRARRALAHANALVMRHRDVRRRQTDLEASLLAKAFRGALVPQNPNDEPAEAMLARLRGANGTAKTHPKRP